MTSNAKLYEMLIYTRASFPQFDPVVKNIMDSHLEYLKTTGNTQTLTIDNKYKGQYYGDFYAILNNLGINAKYHRIIMLLNGITNPIDYVGQLETVFVPDTTIIDQILSVYNTGKSKLLTEAGQ